MSISTARIRRECEGGGFCHEMAYEVCRERDAQAAEIEAAWKMIESEFDIEPRAQIEAEAKTNGFKYGLAQAIHAIWKRDAKVSGLTAERDHADLFARTVLSSLHWTGDGYGWTGGRFDYRMSPSEAASLTTSEIEGLRDKVKEQAAELADLRAKLAAAEKEAALRSDMIDSDCMAAINTLRMSEGNSVTLICDNPDFGGPNNAIECSGDWTNWQTKRFTGDRLLTSLQSALKEYFAWHGEEWEPTKRLTAVRTAAAPFEDSRPVDEATIREVYKDDEITTLHYRQGGKQLRIDRKEYSFSFGVMSDGGVFYGPFRIKTIGQLNHLLAALRPGGVN